MGFPRWDVILQGLSALVQVLIALAMTLSRIPGAGLMSSRRSPLLEYRAVWQLTQLTRIRDNEGDPLEGVRPGGPL